MMQLRAMAARWAKPAHRLALREGKARGHWSMVRCRWERGGSRARKSWGRLVRIDASSRAGNTRTGKT